MAGIFLKTAGAHDPAQVFEHCLHNWAEFCGFVRDMEGLKTAPAQPVLAFITKHVGIAINFKNQMKLPLPLTVSGPVLGQPQAVDGGMVLGEPLPVNGKQIYGPAAMEPAPPKISAAELEDLEKELGLS